MTSAELFRLLKKSNLPVAYHHFEEDENISPPFIVFIRESCENIPADDRVYVKKDNYSVELYTNKKNTVLEGVIEQIFDDNDIFYDIEEVYIESEKMYEVIYNIET